MTVKLPSPNNTHVACKIEVLHPETNIFLLSQIKENESHAGRKALQNLHHTGEVCLGPAPIQKVVV